MQRENSICLFFIAILSLLGGFCTLLKIQSRSKFAWSWNWKNPQQFQYFEPRKIVKWISSALQQPTNAKIVSYSSYVPWNFANTPIFRSLKPGISRNTPNNIFHMAKIYMAHMVVTGLKEQVLTTTVPIKKTCAIFWRNSAFFGGRFYSIKFDYNCDGVKKTKTTSKKVSGSSRFPPLFGGRFRFIEFFSFLFRGSHIFYWGHCDDLYLKEVPQI
jgi:hypothetical protein